MNAPIDPRRLLMTTPPNTPYLPSITPLEPSPVKNLSVSLQPPKAKHG